MKVVSQSILPSGDVLLTLTQGYILVPLINPLDDRPLETRVEEQASLIENS